MSDLDKIRERLNNSNGGGGNSQSNSGAFYPFWNAPVDTTVSIRFLPDGDENNVFFWRERQIIRIPFASVEGHPELENVIVEVPCMKMYGKNEVCPIQAETKPWWKTEKEDLARRYWPKKTYLYQGFVRASELQEDETPENPIRRFVINKPIHQMIEAALMDPEMENTPTDYDNGTDFKIVKRQGAKYYDYSTSSFARKESALTQDERDAIDQFGLFDLSTFLPKKPDENEQKVIYEMFLESLKGDDATYRLEWANTFRPKGVELNVSATSSAGNTSTSSSTKTEEKEESASKPEKVEEKEPETPESNDSKEEGSGKADDILAQLRSRIND